MATTKKDIEAAPADMVHAAIDREAIDFVRAGTTKPVPDEIQQTIHDGVKLLEAIEDTGRTQLAIWADAVDPDNRQTPLDEYTARCIKSFLQMLAGNG